MVSPVIVPFNRLKLPGLFQQLGYTTGAEIGVRRGSFSLLLCQAIPQLHLICVDAWQQYKTRPPLPSQYRQDENYQITLDKLKGYDVEIIRKMSMGAVQAVPLESLDFVYIDAHHGYSYVAQDILEWGKRVRPGGMISGDDYRATGVYLAVDEFVEQNSISRWFVTRCRNASWFWLKSPAPESAYENLNLFTLS
jgi:hypothetical protein